MYLFLLGLGIVLTSLGLSFIFLYSNLLTMGYTFLNFVYFISKRIECWFLVIGLFLIIYAYERWLKNVLLLRHTSKFCRK